jgi:hypothetical protein
MTGEGVLVLCWFDSVELDGQRCLVLTKPYWFELTSRTGAPPSLAVKVGGELSAGKRRQLGQRQNEGCGHGGADFDRRIGGDRARESVEVRTEAREPHRWRVGRGEASRRGA